MTKNDWLDVREVCEIARPTRRTLSRVWADGEGPRFTQLGRQRLVHADWLEDWMFASERLSGTKRRSTARLRTGRSSLRRPESAALSQPSPALAFFTLPSPWSPRSGRD